MEVITDLTKRQPEPAVLTIGNFDGIHLGHQQLLRLVRARAIDLGVRSVVMTFDPHTRLVVRPNDPLPLLTPLPEKLTELAELGLDEVVVIPFTPELTQWDARQFLTWVRETLPFRELWVGPDFALGHHRTGNTTMLAALGEELGFQLRLFPHVQVEEQVASSTAIRQALLAGDIRRASALLGRYPAVSGIVVPGARRGRELGFPTANLDTPPGQALPADGIYATLTLRPRTGETLPSLTSIGTRPTFGPGERLVEVYLLDFAGDIYGEELVVRFVDFLRPQVAYTGAEALIAQMHQDVAQARTLLADVAPAAPVPVEEQA
jgi:riboflavin kinase/FMN adenylyltransferase